MSPETHEPLGNYWSAAAAGQRRCIPRGDLLTGQWRPTIGVIVILSAFFPCFFVFFFCLLSFLFFFAVLLFAPLLLE